MMNPCYECPKYREYGEYLDEVLISKTPCSGAVNAEPVESGKKKKAVRVSVKAKPLEEKEPDLCLMEGCGRISKVKGYCQSCFSLRHYHKRLGNPMPEALTPEQIKRRKSRGK